MVLLAGFLGGRRAGGVGKALTSALIVGTSHGFVVYLMVLVGLELMLGLPHAGGYVDAGIGFLGGIHRRQLYRRRHRCPARVSNTACQLGDGRTDSENLAMKSPVNAGGFALTLFI